MQPYVIKQGDYLAALAHQLGFDADTVWNDPANAQLRALRPDPNLLWPTDVLYIPDPAPAAAQSLVPGSTNSFVTNEPTVTVSLKFTDPALASQPFTVTELPELTGLATNADGTTSFVAPITQGSVTVVFTSDGTTFGYDVGHLDPIDTLSGIFQRLQNLGFIDPSASVQPRFRSTVRRDDFFVSRAPFA